MKTSPWYRHRWPWLLMLGPAVVVVAGICTFVLAVQSFDGFVVEPSKYQAPITQATSRGG